MLGFFQNSVLVSKMNVGNQVRSGTELLPSLTPTFGEEKEKGEFPATLQLLPKSAAPIYIHIYNGY